MSQKSLFSSRSSCLLCLCCLISLPLKAQQRVDVGLFSEGSVNDWRQKEFAGETQYELQGKSGEQVLRAQSHGAASAFYRKIKVDLNKTPVLHWSWRKIEAPNTQNEREKSGDDFAARIYVVKSGGVFFWNTRAINYVWSSKQPTAAVWDNPFAGDNAKMLAVRNSDDSQWHFESRNVLEDFKQIQQHPTHYIDGVAIMTDSDNSASTAVAEYGDIYFTAE